MKGKMGMEMTFWTGNFYKWDWECFHGNRRECEEEEESFPHTSTDTFV